LIGLNQYFAGFEWHNLWNAGHVLNFQFTASFDFDSYQSYAVSYDAALPWGHHFVAYGGYADVGANLSVFSPQLSDYQQSGRNWIGGARYVWPLHDLRAQRSNGAGDRLVYQHEFFFGADYKDINSSLQFGSDNVTDDPFTIAQGVIGYRGRETDSRGFTLFSISAVGAPGDIGPYSSTSDYQAIRPGAESHYVYGRLNLSRETRLIRTVPIFWNVDFQGQIATGPLMPSEQLSYGGLYTIRGFEPGVILADDGVIVRNELGFEVPRLNEWLTWGGREGKARIFGFFDYGYSILLDDGSSPADGFSMGSVGGGIRFNWGPHFQAVMDYGYQVIGQDAEVVGGAAAANVSGRFDAYVMLSF